MRMRRFALLLALVLMTAICGAAMGCTRSRVATPAASPVVANESAWRAQADAARSVLFDWTLSSDARTREPRGDLTASPDSRTWFVNVDRMGAEGTSAVVDVQQIYYGAQAVAEAKRDGAQEPPGDIYVRNRYQHQQLLPFASPAVVAFLDPPGSVEMTASTPAVFSRRFGSSPAYSSNQVGYLATVVDGKITDLVQVYGQ